jgi:hypothetical protein
VVTQAGEQTILALKKLGAMFLLLVGLGLTAVSFNNGSIGFAVLGLLLIAGGAVLLILKIIRRNPS